jgi:TIR domain
MAYVPKCEADIFVSYAHADDADAPPGATRVSWSELLITELEREIRKRLGREVGSDFKVWRDTTGIRLGDNWRTELEDAIKGSATFLALVSPNYMTSIVCSQERETFLRVFDDRDPQAALELLAQSKRFIKLIRLPLDGNEHLKFLPDLHHLELYERDPRGVAGEMLPASDAFRRRILEGATAIKDILQALRRQREKVFIAWPADDCEPYWKSVRLELSRQGYDVQPPGRIDDLMSDDQLRDKMGDARLSIHLLGAAYNGGAERQIRIAAELELRQFFWLAREALTTTDERQRRLIKNLQNGKLNQGVELPMGWSLLESGSLQSLYGDVLAVLKQPYPSRVPSRPADEVSMYLCCDRTTSDDASFADRLRGDIQHSAGLAVLLPPDDPAERKSHHERTLKSCDSVLVYGGAAPREWLGQVVEDVTYAESSFQRRPLRAKALLTPDISPWSSYPLRMIACKPQFSLEDLQPFLDSVRQGAPPGGRA